MATQTRQAHPVGFTPSAPGSGSATLALNSAAIWLAYSFVPSESLTLAKVKIFLSSITGSLVLDKISLDVFSDSAGLPNISLGTTTTLATNPPVAASTWMEFSGGTIGVALTAGTQYWLVVKNLNTTPASNFPTIKYGDSGTSNALLGSGTLFGWGKRHSTDSGATWVGGSSANITGVRIEYTGSVFDGTPFSNTGAVSAASAVFANREVGNVFTLFANAQLNIRGIGFFVTKTGTPTGSLRFRLYNGTTLLATTNSISVSNISGGMWVVAYFGADQTISAGASTIRAVVSETAQADTSANCFQPYESTIENDANSRALMPFDGTCFKTVTTDSTATPPVFTDTNTGICPFFLLLDTAGEFASSGGSTTLSAARTIGGM